MRPLYGVVQNAEDSSDDPPVTMPAVESTCWVRSVAPLGAVRLSVALGASVSLLSWSSAVPVRY